MRDHTIDPWAQAAAQIANRDVSRFPASFGRPRKRSTNPRRSYVLRPQTQPPLFFKKNRKQKNFWIKQRPPTEMVRPIPPEPRRPFVVPPQRMGGVAPAEMAKRPPTTQNTPHSIHQDRRSPTLTGRDTPPWR